VIAQPVPAHEQSAAPLQASVQFPPQNVILHELAE